MSSTFDNHQQLFIPNRKFSKNYLDSILCLRYVHTHKDAGNISLLFGVKPKNLGHYSLHRLSLYLVLEISLEIRAGRSKANSHNERFSCHQSWNMSLLCPFHSFVTFYFFEGIQMTMHRSFCYYFTPFCIILSHFLRRYSFSIPWGWTDDIHIFSYLQ